MRPSTGQLPSLEEVYVTPVPDNLPHDFPSLLRPPFRGAVSINGKLLAVFIMRTAPASTPYGKSSPRRKSHRPTTSSSSSNSSHIHRFLFLLLSGVVLYYILYITYTIYIMNLYYTMFTHNHISSSSSPLYSALCSPTIKQLFFFCGTRDIMMRWVVGTSVLVQIFFIYKIPKNNKRATSSCPTLLMMIRWQPSSPAPPSTKYLLACSLPSPAHSMTMSITPIIISHSFLSHNLTIIANIFFSCFYSHLVHCISPLHSYLPYLLTSTYATHNLLFPNPLMLFFHFSSWYWLMDLRLEQSSMSS